MVLTLDDERVITIFSINDLKDYVDKEIYEYILEETTVDNSELEDRLTELEVENDDLSTDVAYYEETKDSLLGILDDIRDMIEEDEDKDKIIKFIGDVIDTY